MPIDDDATRCTRGVSDAQVYAAIAYLDPARRPWEHLERRSSCRNNPVVAAGLPLLLLLSNCLALLVLYIHVS